ncbi:hypothetical protein HG530_003976 [Fusarium avenaceum]|nr:hypothetical protein HG530_003976 [Fusarium avenaceum]
MISLLGASANLELLGKLAVRSILADGPDHGTSKTLAASKVKLELPGIDIVVGQPRTAKLESLDGSSLVQIA